MTQHEILQEIEMAWAAGYILGIAKDSRDFRVGAEIPLSPNLDGTCCVSVCYFPTNSEDENISNIKKALSLCSRYVGTNVYLIGGLDFYFGGQNNDREMLLVGAKIFAKI